MPGDLPVIQLNCMKTARLFPLAFIADVHGFMLLAPYLVLCLTVVRTMQIFEARKQSRVVERAKPEILISDSPAL